MENKIDTTEIKKRIFNYNTKKPPRDIPFGTFKKRSEDRQDIINEIFGICEIDQRMRYTVEKENKSDNWKQNFYKY